MKQFIITYIGGDQPESPEQGKAHFEKYQQWLASLGEQAVVPMQPYKNTQVIASDGSVSGGSAAGISGHTLIQAESIETAIDIAKGCPFLDTNGRLEVAELVQMGGG